LESSIKNKILEGKKLGEFACPECVEFIMATPHAKFFF